MEFVTEEQVLLDQDAQSREEVLLTLCAKAVSLGIARNQEEVLSSFMQREALGATGLTDGFAVPHAKSDAIMKPSVIVLKNRTKVDWPSFDEGPVDIVVALFVPGAENKEEHIRMLSKTAVLLMDAQFRSRLREADDAAAIAAAFNRELAGE